MSAEPLLDQGHATRGESMDSMYAPIPPRSLSASSLPTTAAHSSNETPGTDKAPQFNSGEHLNKIFLKVNNVELGGSTRSGISSAVSHGCYGQPLPSSPRAMGAGLRPIGVSDAESVAGGEDETEWIPEPHFTVSEFKAQKGYAVGIRAEEMVYKIYLDFGGLGAWDVHMTKGNLGTLIAGLQFRRVFDKFEVNLEKIAPPRMMRRTSVSHVNVGTGTGTNISKCRNNGPVGHSSLVGGDNAATLHRAISDSGVTNSNVPGGRGESIDVAHSVASPRRPTIATMRQVSQRFPPPREPPRVVFLGQELVLPALGSNRNIPLQSSPAQGRASTRFTGAEEKKRHVVTNLAEILFVPGNSAAKRERRLNVVRTLLQQMLSEPKTRAKRVFKEFMQISSLTFNPRFGKSFKEGWVKVTVSSRNRENEKLEWKGKVRCLCCVCACAPDKQRINRCLQPGYRNNRKMWCVVKDSFIAFFSDGPSKANPVCADIVLIFSKSFQVYKGYSTTGSHRTITLVEDSKTVRIKFQHRWIKKVWSASILEALRASDTEAESEQRGGWGTTHENTSFAPRRFFSAKPSSEMARAQWLVDGESTFAAIREAILGAQQQIFVQGWWVSANLPLIRPSHVNDPESTVMDLLARKAAEGVQVCVLMYNNVKVALGLDSEFQEKQLHKAAAAVGGTDNMNVLRHPFHSDTLFWSHHEKLVVIDQRQAFCGGIDLAWGRFDNFRHSLYDPLEGRPHSLFPGIDFNNARIKELKEVTMPEKDVHPTGTPRMPWHDVHCEHRGAVARDLARHFIQQWNHARFSTVQDQRDPELVPMDNLPFEDLVQPEHMDATEPAAPVRIDHFLPKNRRTPSPIDEEKSASVGDLPDKDELNDGQAANSIDTEPQHFVSAPPIVSSALRGRRDQEKEHGKEALPAIKETDKDKDSGEDDVVSEATIDYGEDTENEESSAKESDSKKSSRTSEQELDSEQVSTTDHLVTSSEVTTLYSSTTEEEEEEEEEGEQEHGEQEEKQNIPKLVVKDSEEEEQQAEAFNFEWGYPVDAQVLRSRGLWSGACPGEKETSLHAAMINLIQGAERFIFIENQFFISGLDSDARVHNRILDALFKRIVVAHQANRPFKIYIIIPLIPGFDGFVSENNSIRRVMYFQYRSICRGEKSLFHNLLRKGIDPDAYICFFGLRTWQRLGDTKVAARLGTSKLISEIVYVHSKVLVVDDEVCIVGSGNVNDRSMVGDRDSEVGVLMRTPPDFISAKRNQSIKANSSVRIATFDASMAHNFAFSLRTALFEEHFGINPELTEAINQPWTDASFIKLRAVAACNTGIFDMVFPHAVPRNSIRTLSQLKRTYFDGKFSQVDYSKTAEDALHKVQGQIVLMPTGFLADWEGIKPSFHEDAVGTALGDELFI